MLPMQIITFLGDIKSFLDNWADLNEVLKSVAFDITKMVYKSNVRALGNIDKMITGSFWRLIEKVGTAVESTPQLVALQAKLKELTLDPYPLFRGETYSLSIQISTNMSYLTVCLIMKQMITF